MGGMRGGVGYEGRGLMGERWVGKEWEQEASAKGNEVGKRGGIGVI